MSLIRHPPERVPLMLRRLLKPLWFVLALVFLIEAWLWDHLQPVAAWIVARIPLRAIKAWLAARIAELSPALTLVVFLIPAIVLLPFKLGGVWLLGHGYWLSAFTVLVAAKLVGVGVAAFIFDVTRPKLLEMAWFRQLYEWVLRVRAWADALVAPARARIRAFIARGRAGALRRILIQVQRFRRVVQARAARPDM